MTINPMCSRTANSFRPKRRINIKKIARGKSSTGQTILEYVAVIGLAIAVLMAMGPMMRRGIQGMIRLVADQVGDQRSADQLADDKYGHLINSVAISRARIDKVTKDRVGEVNYIYEDRAVSGTRTFANLGFTERQQQ